MHNSRFSESQFNESLISMYYIIHQLVFIVLSPQSTLIQRSLNHSLNSLDTISHLVVWYFIRHRHLSINLPIEKITIIRSICHYVCIIYTLVSPVHLYLCILSRYVRSHHSHVRITITYVSYLLIFVRHHSLIILRCSFVMMLSYLFNRLYNRFFISPPFFVNYWMW